MIASDKKVVASCNKATASLYIEETATQTMFFQDQALADGIHVVSVSVPLLNIKLLAQIINHHSPWYDRGEGVKLLVQNVVLRCMQDAINNIIWQSEDNFVNMYVFTRAIVYYVAKWVNVGKLSYSDYRAIYREVSYVYNNFLRYACLEIAKYLANASRGEVLNLAELNAKVNGSVKAVINIMIQKDV